MMQESLVTMVTSKDSPLVKRATESLMGNSGYAKVVGDNIGNLQEQLISGSKQNIIGMSSGRARKELSVQDDTKLSMEERKSLYAKNLKNLSYMYRNSYSAATEANGVDLIAMEQTD